MQPRSVTTIEGDMTIFRSCSPLASSAPVGGTSKRQELDTTVTSSADERVRALPDRMAAPVGALST
jgi:hypothetical protein